MVMNAIVTLTDIQLREILVKYFQEEGLGCISHQDISFNVEYVRTGPEKDCCGMHKFTGVTVKNIKVGTPTNRD